MKSKQETARSSAPVLISIILWMIVATGSALYVSYFSEELSADDWSGRSGFTHIVLPDTFIYKNLFEDAGNSVEGIAVAGVKNALGPLLTWSTLQFNWHYVAIFNSILVLISLILALRLCVLLRIPRSSALRITIVLGLMPVMIYYCIGATKELPTLLLVTAFVYFYLRGSTLGWIAASALLFVFRYQLLLLVLVFVSIDKVSRHPVRLTGILLLAVSACFPLFATLGILNPETTEFLREESESQSGAPIEQIRNSIPIASAIAIVVRVLQSLFVEPISALLLELNSFVAGGDFSIMAFAIGVSSIVSAPYWLRAVYLCIRSILQERQMCSIDANRLYSFILIFLVPVGGFSLIHHRYLFPLTVLIFVASLQGKASGRLQTPQRFKNETLGRGISIGNTQTPR